jgi:hypothetical protein
MKMSASGKLCPICRKENEETASVCVYCGAQLDEENATSILSTPENLDGRASTPVVRAESFIDVAMIPEGGLGIHIAGEFKPIYVKINKELIIGRVTEAGWADSETILDLTNQNAASLGLSRQHVTIRQAGTGFEVIDLSSRNGTWLNAERLIPNKSLIRL